MPLDLLAEVRTWARQAQPELLGNEVVLANLAIEHLQLEILRAITTSQLGSFVVFQGGTALRRFYGNSRFSEDLDFAVRPAVLEEPHLRDSLPVAITGLARTLQKHLPPRFGLVPSELAIREPDDAYAIIPAPGRTGVVSWRIRILIAAGQQRMVKIDVAAVPAHTLELRVPLSPLATLPRLAIPAFYVPVEAERELLADKVVALAARPYLKGRDLWDLARVFHAPVPPPAELLELLGRKIADYRLGSAAELATRLEARAEELARPDTLTRYVAEMTRFVMPEALREPAHLRADIEACARLARSVAASLVAPAPEGPRLV